MKVARIFSDEEGGSHFDDVEISFSDTAFIEGAQPIGLSEAWLAERVSMAKIPSGWSNPQHPTPARQIIVYLGGAAEMTTSDGETRVFEKGDVVMLEDVSGTGHGARFVSEGEALVVLIRLT
jgi:hypothetical protein